MKYMLLIHQGTALDDWETLSDDEKHSIYAAYKEIRETPGVVPGLQLDRPGTATTVRVRSGKRKLTDGPFAETKEAIGGYLLFETDSQDAAIELAAKIPAARFGGAVEVRPIVEG